MRVIAGVAQGSSAEAADVGRAAADLRQAARDAVQRAGARGWPVHGCSTATPAPARVGIEALSRGAAHVTFVERDRRAQALVAENLARCGRRRVAMLLSARLWHGLPKRCGTDPHSCHSTSFCSIRPTTSRRRSARRPLAGRRRVCSRTGRSGRARTRAPAAGARHRRPAGSRAGLLTSGDSSLSFYTCQP